MLPSNDESLWLMSIMDDELVNSENYKDVSEKISLLFNSIDP